MFRDGTSARLVSGVCGESVELRWPAASLQGNFGGVRLFVRNLGDCLLDIRINYARGRGGSASVRVGEGDFQRIPVARNRSVKDITVTCRKHNFLTKCEFQYILRYNSNSAYTLTHKYGRPSRYKPCGATYEIDLGRSARIDRFELDNTGRCDVTARVEYGNNPGWVDIGTIPAGTRGRFNPDSRKVAVTVEIVCDNGTYACKFNYWIDYR